MACCYCSRMVSKVSFSIGVFANITYFIRCNAHPSNLDAGGARERNHEKMDFLIGTWDPGTLWDDFGIRANIVVSLSSHFLLQVSNLYLQPFTHGFPHADIHKLLSADLLHQVIKGTFKDHIVMWVNEYLMEEHSKAAVLAIIADIDCQ
jgi:hypothetical protein